MNDCNCPLCTKTPMEEGKVYRCKKGGIMGVTSMDCFAPSLPVLHKILNDDFANEQADRDIDEQIKQSLK